MEALRTERHSGDIELKIFMRKTICLRFIIGVIPYERELFAEIKSSIFAQPKFTMSFLCIDFLISLQFVMRK